MCLLVALLMFPMVAMAAEKVSGTVTDSNGDPLVGVSVIIKGTQFGT